MHWEQPLRVLACVLATWFAASPFAAGQTLTFDEIEYTRVDGLTVGGVEFSYTKGGSGSSDAHYASFGPGTLVHVTDPSLVGDAGGQLTLRFQVPTAQLAFGLAVSRGESLAEAATVKLFDDAGTNLGSYPISTTAADPLSFSEGLYNYNGPAISRMELTFAAGLGSFAVDNLRYAVPEPSGLGLMAGGSLWLATRRRRRMGVPS